MKKDPSFRPCDVSRPTERPENVGVKRRPRPFGTDVNEFVIVETGFIVLNVSGVLNVVGRVLNVGGVLHVVSDVPKLVEPVG